MRLFPAGRFTALVLASVIAASLPAFAQTSSTATPPTPVDGQANAEALAQALQGLNERYNAQFQQGVNQGVNPYNIPGIGNPLQPPPKEEMTQEELDELLKDPDSPEYKAHMLAKKARGDLDLFGVVNEQDETETVSDLPTPPEIDSLQGIHEANGTDYGIADEAISDKAAIDMRRDSQREAALSYGARGGLAKRSYQIMEQLQGYERVLDRVFDFRALLSKAPSGMMIEPPIVRESVDALTITDGGNEAAVADQILKISKQSRIVTAPRDWRQYIAFRYETHIAPPPKILWPADKNEQAEWNNWVEQGWKEGYSQADQIFESGLNRLLADYTGMVRYRMLLAEGKVSQAYALQEDRGVTGGKNEMRVGDRALRITGPSQFLTGADLWKPADR